MRYYIAYGSNLNKEQMKSRCPDAVPVGTSEIKNYTLLFKGHPNRAVATIEPKQGCVVPIAIWSISRNDEKRLDIYEGFPRLYEKQMFKVSLDGKTVAAMVYVMTTGHKAGKPSEYYLNTILQGYKDFGIDTDILLSFLSEEEKAGLSAFDIIEKIAEDQQSGDFEICPRCGEKAMREKLHYNCLSRRADIYICESCGAQEALCDYAGKTDNTSDWYAVRAVASCNNTKHIK